MATMETPDEYETFEKVDVPDGASAEQVAELISEQFHDPNVTAVVTVFGDDVVEFDASDIGSITAVEGQVHGMIRETPDVESIEQLRVRSKPWLSDRISEIASMRNDTEATLHYDSRFGGDVSKTITIEEVGVEQAEAPHGLELDEERVDMAAAFGYKQDAEFAVLAQSNGGVQVLMNDTKIVEPGTVPRFEVQDEA